ncbi:LpqB family beta-propeller domain-containing protein [Arthrobacter psychrochitiniphilus]|uniref:LpqB family beta-propeller domain-containing protein n=1 Tax=Arthrobacter psychrochitiniphilus TaxID=291045 RepID=UPI003F7CD281
MGITARTAQHPAAHTRRPAAHTRRNWPVALWAMAVVVLLAVSGCATIPMQGPVGKSDPLAPRNNSVNVSLQQFSPVDGASPESIIRGFVDSGTGVSDDFQVARQYLTPALAQSWAPDKRTLVYTNTFAVAPTYEQDTFELKFDVVSTVDATGVLTPAKPDSSELLRMKMVQVDGQWRISEAPDGVILTEANFQTLFAPVSLYFYDPSFTFGVPDVRWLAGRSSRTATSIVKAMLNGPAPYLQGAVVSAFPNGIALERDSVPVINGQARVGLTAGPLLETSIEQRQQMNAQLLTTFQKSLNTITEVAFLADDRSVDMGSTDNEVSRMIVDNPVRPTQVALSKNELVTFDGVKSARIPGMASVAGLDPSAPAISYSGKDFAFLAGVGNQIYWATPNEPPVLALSGVGLTPPSFAPNGWLFSAAGDGSGLVLAINPDDNGKLGAPVLLRVPWLVGQEVSTFRVSRDGTRALVISQSNGISKVNMTGIFKSGEVPKELTTPINFLHSGMPTLGVWVGGASVAVMAPSDTDPVVIDILDLAARPLALDELKGVQWISAGSGVRNIHAQTATEFFTNVGSYWEVAAKELQQASFAG